MISRIAWLAAGAAAGAYATIKGRRVAYRLSPPGVADQIAAAGAGWREFRTEMNAGMSAREHDLTSRLDQAPIPRTAIESDHPKDP